MDHVDNCAIEVGGVAIKRQPEIRHRQILRHSTRERDDDACLSERVSFAAAAQITVYRVKTRSILILYMPHCEQKNSHQLFILLYYIFFIDTGPPAIMILVPVITNLRCR